MRFTFETCKSAEAAKEQLVRLFPEGTKVTPLNHFMDMIKAQRYEYTDTDTRTEQLFYHYTQSGLMVHTKWIVGVDLDSEQRIQNLTVRRGFAGV